MKNIFIYPDLRGSLLEISYFFALTIFHIHMLPSMPKGEIFGYCWLLLLLGYVAIIDVNIILCISLVIADWEDLMIWFVVLFSWSLFCKARYILQYILV